MAKQFKQVKSSDALTIIIEGDTRNPEPMSCIIKFPGGSVEVTRCTDDTYWAHIGVEDLGNVIDSRVDHAYDVAHALDKIPSFPRAEEVNHIALRIAAKVRAPDYG